MIASVVAMVTGFVPTERIKVDRSHSDKFKLNLIALKMKATFEWTN
jgi:hypothetical protein